MHIFTYCIGTNIFYSEQYYTPKILFDRTNIYHGNKYDWTDLICVYSACMATEWIYHGTFSRQKFKVLEHSLGKSFKVLKFLVHSVLNFSVLNFGSNAHKNFLVVITVLRREIISWVWNHQETPQFTEHRLQSPDTCLTSGFVPGSVLGGETRLHHECECAYIYRPGVQGDPTSSLRQQVSSSRREFPLGASMVARSTKRSEQASS